MGIGQPVRRFPVAVALGLLGLGLAGVFLSATTLVFNPQSAHGPSKPSNRHLLNWSGSQGFTPVRSHKPTVVFGTIFQSELHYDLGLQNETTTTDGLVELLKKMEATGLNEVVYSVSWEYVAPAPDTLRLDYLDKIMEATTKHSSHQVGHITCLHGLLPTATRPAPRRLPCTRPRPHPSRSATVSPETHPP